MDQAKGLACLERQVELLHTFSYVDAFCGGDSPHRALTCDGSGETHVAPGNVGDCHGCSLELTLGYAEVPQQ